jgi:hypothetical protein
MAAGGYPRLGNLTHRPSVAAVRPKPRAARADKIEPPQYLNELPSTARQPDTTKPQAERQHREKVPKLPVLRSQ